MGIEDKPQLIWNCDETGINGEALGRSKAYGIKGERLCQKKARLYWTIFSGLNVVQSTFPTN